MSNSRASRQRMIDVTDIISDFNKSVTAIKVRKSHNIGMSIHIDDRKFKQAINNINHAFQQFTKADVSDCVKRIKRYAVLLEPEIALIKPINEQPNYKNRNGNKGRNRFKY